MVGGSISSSSIVDPTISPGETTVSTVSTTTKCSGSNCDLNDVGKPDPTCGPVLNGCHNNNGNLIGCYDPSTATCFIGGSLCPKPLLACINLSSPTQGAPCYDTNTYSCNNGNLSLNILVG